MDIHAIVVVTIGLVTSRIVVVILSIVIIVVNCYLNNKNRFANIAFKCITLLQIKLALC